MTTLSPSPSAPSDERAVPGPAAPRRAGVLSPLPLTAVTLSPERQLGAWQELNRVATIPHCVTNMESSGALDNVRRLVGRSDKPFTGFWFADSDLHKTLEAIAWQHPRGLGEQEQAFLDDTLALLAEAQEDDGYLDTFVQGSDSEPRWDHLRWSHELYVAGHLIQAAVALHRTSGDERLLGIARKLADLLVREFGQGGRDLYDGHPEVETALVELYRETGHEPYLELARRQIELRGSGALGEDKLGPQYFQDHAPVREATEAIGHAVRQLYLAAGVTDLYLETGDESLLEAMKALWDSAFLTKTYITGAHGSRHRDEAYGDPYELPPDRAYAETCASIASFHWNWRMLLATGEAKYAEEMERALYNSIAASTSEDGTHFFYTNPLQMRTGHDGSTEDAPSERLSWYACACCPPNLARLMASVHGYLATSSADGVQLQLLTEGVVHAATPGGAPITLELATDYPWDGAVSVTVRGNSDEAWELAVRVPVWAKLADVTLDGEALDASVGEDGYLRIRRSWTDGAKLAFTLPMTTRVIHPNPLIDAVRGCVALARGPLVYCLEQPDQEDGVRVEDLRIDPSQPPQPVLDFRPDVPVALVGPAQAVVPQAPGLYAEDPAQYAAQTRPTTLTAIPYFRWANRGANAMRVWIPTA